jgi:hypothetical protein
MRKIEPTSGLDPRTVRPPVSRYTDCAIPAHKHELYKKLKFNFNRFLIFNLKKNKKTVGHAIVRSGWRVSLFCLRVLMSAEEALPREQKAVAIHCGCVQQHCCHTSQCVCAPPPPPQIFIKHNVVLPFMLTAGSWLCYCVSSSKCTVKILLLFASYISTLLRHSVFHKFANFIIRSRKIPAVGRQFETPHISTRNSGT